MANTAVYSDIDIELSQSTDGDILRDTDEEAVMNSIVNIIQTVQGTRRMLPSFAADVQKILFEPIDEGTTDLIRSNIITNVNKWDDRVYVEGLYINPVYDKGMYKCLMRFQIIGFNVEGVRSIRFVLRRD